MPQLGWSARPDGHIDFYNRGWYDYTGTTPDEMAGWGWKSVHDPDHLDEVVRRWQRSIETGTPFEMEFPLRRHDGVFRWFLTRVNPVFDANGAVTRWVGVNTDIDDNRLARALAAAVVEQSRETEEVIRALHHRIRELESDEKRGAR
ncbi:MAG: PAS domain-containing protein [Deltaproteobacteria bacterium]|nr:PAS domain-containing protein [Deltaproteobacteria bacterium]